MMRIDRWNPRTDGPLSERALRRKIGTSGYQVSIINWEPGAVFPPETRTRQQIEAVLAGMVRITVDDESTILTAGDVIYVPRGAVRRAEVVGPSPARFLAAR